MWDNVTSRCGAISLRIFAASSSPDGLRGEKIPVHFDLKIPELGFSITIDSPLTMCAVSISNLCGFSDIGNSRSEIVRYKEYATIYPYVTALTINNVEILDLKKHYAKLKLKPVKNGTWAETTQYAYKRLVVDPPGSGVQSTPNQNTNSKKTSDKIGKSLKITSLVLDIASSLDPTGVTSSIKQVHMSCVRCIHLFNHQFLLFLCGISMSICVNVSVS